MEQRIRGKRGENIALDYLLRSGYVTLARNVHIGHNEIDLIMRDIDTIVFVEVKARSSFRYGLPAEAVGKKKQARLLMAAQEYLQALPSDTHARFDVVEVDLSKGTVSHIINAFMDN